MSFFFAFILLGNLSAQMVVRHVFESEDRISQLEEALFLSAGVACIDFGLSSIRSEYNAEYILNAEYYSEEEKISINYRLSSNDSSLQILAELSVTINMDYDFDAQINSEISELLSQAGFQQVTNSRARILDLFKEAEEEGDVEVTEIVEPENNSVSSEQDWPEKQSVMFTPSLSTNFVMLFGDITELFHYGAGTYLNLLLCWPQESFSFSTGLRGSFLAIFNDSGVTGGQLLLPSVGAMVQFGSRYSRSPGYSVGVSFGATFMTVVDDSSSLTKTVPYADVTAQLFFPLDSQIYLGGELGFLGIIDEDLLIIGASPSLFLKIEL